MQKNIFFSLLSTLLIAGCINFPGTQQASVDTTNIITMQPASISVIPKPPINVDTQFTVTFEIKNQEKQKTISVDVNLFDWGVCKDVSLACATEDKTKCKFNLVPQQTELVEVKAKSPSKEEIGGIAASCPIQWRTTYKFDTTSSSGTNVVSRSRLTELQRAGKTVEVPAIPSVVGTGPLKPYITFSAPEGYVTSDSPLQMKVQVRDEGEGSFPQIAKSQLSIIVPKEWYDELTDSEKATVCTDNFDHSISSDGKTVIFENKEVIVLINRQTTEQVCNFKAPNLDSQQIPQKSYNVLVKLKDYLYSIDGKQTIDIKP